MEIEKQAYRKLINVLSGLVLLMLAILCAVAAERYNAPFLVFFTGWFCRSAWVRVQEHDAAVQEFKKVRK